MKKTSLVLALLAVGALASGAAQAHGRHGHGHARIGIGLHFGFPLHSPWYYAPPPVYYYPQPVYVPASPPVYVERADERPEEPRQDWWYYCEDSRGYYPYVKSCLSGWKRVPPAPPPG